MGPEVRTELELGAEKTHVGQKVRKDSLRSEGPKLFFGFVNPTG